MNFHQRRYTCVVPPRGYSCAVPPRNVATVTARDAFFTSGDKHVLVRNNVISVGFQEICRRFLTGDVSPISVTAKKICYPQPTSVARVLPLPVTYIPALN